mgnify:CR=1 FL=1
MTRLERIAKVKTDKKELVRFKKASIKFTDGSKGQPLKLKAVSKGELPTDTEDSIFRSIVGNTYYWMDSHEDVHVKGCFTKSIQENKPFFLKDHEFKTGSKIGEFIETREQLISWKDLGVEMEGETISLVHDAEIIKGYNESLFAQYKENKVNQHSVGMYYIKVELAYDDPTDKEAFALYSKTLPLLGNMEQAKENGFFYVVSEAKLQETSAVLRGSNSLTGVLNEGTNEEKIAKLFEKVADIDKINNICDDIKETYKQKPLKNTLPSKPSIFSNLV